jgi:hypothetical protein
MKRAVGSLVALSVLFCSLHGRAAGEGSLVDAHLAWDRGDYVRALTGYLKALPSASASDLESIALQTGELYTTTELTSDGSAPRISPDGRHITYETGGGLKRSLRIAAIEAPTSIKRELPGFAAAFSPDGSRLVYLKIAPTPQLEKEQAALDKAPLTERPQRLAALNQAVSAAARTVVHDIASGVEREIDTGDLRNSGPVIAVDGSVVFAGTTVSDPAQIYAVAPGHAPRPLTDGSGDKSLQEINATGTAAIVAIRSAGSGGRGFGATTPAFGLLSLPDGGWSVIEGSSPSFSVDGRTFAFVVRSENESRLLVADTAKPAAPAVVRKGPERIDAPALSRDGSRVAFQMMPREDWELFVINRDGSGERRVTREIQHDLLPRFLGADRLLATIGEPRHRRSYIYDLEPTAAGTVTRRRLFHNNTVRTIAPEYAWFPSPDGARLVISAERDGDTVSPQRGVYLVDLSRTVTREQLRARLVANLSAEEALVAKGQRIFAPIAAAVRTVVGEASVSRVFGYEKMLYEFDSKHVTRPGNALASAYLFDTYKSFGYEPQYQWFEVPSALDGRTANVVATLRGTLNPELVYVVSSHYDSVASGPGADDDSSGTAALLEAARILAGHPQPATIVFASFTGEESGLLGSREFVRRAIAGKQRVVGALNNDMIGWANDNRLDNTIRYSNAGIRDVQHAAAMQFSQLISYDALYYKGTDAAAYYEAYGDIVGGIGSYPVLGNPHYHQRHDVLETINHQLVTEVAKTTAATVMLLASSPSRLSGLKMESYQNGVAALSWTPSPEAGVIGYIVAYGPEENPETRQMTVKNPAATVNVRPGATVLVKAVNAKGLEGWDWARIRIP